MHQQTSISDAGSSGAGAGASPAPAHSLSGREKVAFRTTVCPTCRSTHDDSVSCPVCEYAASRPGAVKVLQTQTPPLADPVVVPTPATPPPKKPAKPAQVARPATSKQPQASVRAKLVDDPAAFVQLVQHLGTLEMERREHLERCIELEKEGARILDLIRRFLAALTETGKAGDTTGAPVVAAAKLSELQSRIVDELAQHGLRSGVELAASLKRSLPVIRSAWR